MRRQDEARAGGHRLLVRFRRHAYRPVPLSLRAESRTIFEDGRFPADYICEAVDQTRGWFYSLHAISTLLFDRPCYKNVICLGHILDAKGEKMSKSRGNVVEPLAGAQQVRRRRPALVLFTASPPGNVRRFSEQLVSEVTRQFMLTLWNVYSFFVTYANIDKFNPAARCEPTATLGAGPLDSLRTQPAGQGR